MMMYVGRYRYLRKSYLYKSTKNTNERLANSADNEQKSKGFSIYRRLPPYPE